MSEERGFGFGFCNEWIWWIIVILIIICILPNLFGGYGYCKE